MIHRGPARSSPTQTRAARQLLGADDSLPPGSFNAASQPRAQHRPRRHPCGPRRSSPAQRRVPGPALGKPTPAAHGGAGSDAADERPGEHGGFRPPARRPPPAQLRGARETASALKAKPGMPGTGRDGRRAAASSAGTGTGPDGQRQPQQQLPSPLRRGAAAGSRRGRGDMKSRAPGAHGPSARLHCINAKDRGFWAARAKRPGTALRRPHQNTRENLPDASPLGTPRR